jgi:hypothetical protein
VQWAAQIVFDVENPGNLQPLTSRPPEWYARRGYDYVLLSSNFRDEWREADVWEEYAKLPEVRRFAGDKAGGKGPTLVVRRTADAPDSQPASEPAMMVRSGATVEDFARLVGYDLAPLTSTDVLLDPVSSTGHPSDAFRVGEAIGLNLYYRALRDGTSTDPNWQIWVHLVDPATGATVAQLDVPPLSGQLRNYPHVVRIPHPVAKWHQGELLAGVYNFDIPASVAPGTYRLETGMWVPPSGPGAKIGYDPQERPPGEVPEGRIVLGDITVR